MTAPLVTIDVARTLFDSNKPFRVELRYQGWTDNGNRSDKWWALEYSGTGPLIECNHGATGARGRKVPYQWHMSKCVTTCRDKLVKGYDYVGGTNHSMPKPPKAQPRIILDGVFAEIRKVVEVGPDHFECFDSGDHFLFDLTESGAEQVASADTFRIRLERLAS